MRVNLKNTPKKCSTNGEKNNFLERGGGETISKQNIHPCTYKQAPLIVLSLDEFFNRSKNSSERPFKKPQKYPTKYLKLKLIDLTWERKKIWKFWQEHTLYVKKELQIDASLYTLLQILSVSVFEKTQLSCALQPDAVFPETPLSSNQLNLFTF